MPDTLEPSLDRPLQPECLPFDEDDIDRCFPGGIGKARPYQRRGAVRDLRADKGGQRLIASVQGTRPRPYHVFVEIGSSDPVRLSAQCSCPVGRSCKHGVAVLLEALKHPPPLQPIAKDPLEGPVGDWLQQLARAAGAAPAPEELAYRLDSPPQPGSSFVLDLRVVRLLKSGGWGADRPCPVQQLQNATAKYVQPDDRAILRLLSGGLWHSPPPLPQDPDLVDLLLRRVLVTGRCRWRKLDAPPLALGPPLPGRLAWHLAGDGTQSVAVELDQQGAVVLPAASPWYVDPHRHLAGPVAFDIARPLVKIALAAPPVTIEQAAAVAGRFARELPGLALPAPRADMVEELRRDPPVPLLVLGRRKRSFGYWDWRTKSIEQTVDAALLGFAYGGVPISLEAPREVRSVEDGKIIVRRRNLGAERAAKKHLEGFGLSHFVAADPGDDRHAAFGFLGDSEDWPRFMFEGLPQLESEGWRVEIEDGFRHRVVDAGGEWVAEVQEGGGWWFSLDLGVVIDGERMPLLPVMTSLLARLRDLGAPDGLDALAQNGRVFGTLPDGRHVALPLDRTKAILATLVELYHPETLSGEGRIGISAGEAVGLAALEAAIGLRWLGGERLRRLAERLANFAGIVKIDPPAGLEDRAAPLSARRPRLAAIFARIRAGRHPRRRYGAGQDRAGAGPYPGRETRGPARPAVSRRLPDERGAELARRGGAARTRAQSAVIARRRPGAAFRRDQ